MLWPETMLMPMSHATTENQADVCDQCNHLGSTVHAATEYHICICGSDVAGGHADACGPCYHLGSCRCLLSVLQPEATWMPTGNAAARDHIELSGLPGLPLDAMLMSMVRSASEDLVYGPICSLCCCQRPS